MRIIQAGVGGFGGSWIHAVKECDGFYHVALVDPNADALQWAGDVTGVPPERRFHSLENALSAVEADGFIDCTPAPCHQSSTIQAIQRGLHVLVEKPIAETMPTAIAMVKAAQQNRKKLMVTQQFRYQDQPRFLRRLLSEGAIGDIDHVIVEFQLQGLMAGWRQKMRHPLLMDMAVHHFDMMRYLLGHNAERVFARTWNPSVSNTQGDMNAFVWVDMEGGVKVNYTGAFASPGTDTGWNGRWVITGSRGSLVWNQKDDWGPVRIFPQHADLSQYRDQHFFTPLPEAWGTPVWAESIGATGHHYDLYHWRACIESNVEPETSGRDNLNTLALTLAAVQSADTNQPTEVQRDFGLS